MEPISNDTDRNLTCCMSMVTITTADSGCLCNATNGTGPYPTPGPSDSPAMGPPLYMYVYVTFLNAVVFLVGVLGNILVIQVSQMIPLPYVYVTFLNAVVFLVGVLGNIFVIQVVARTKTMRRRMNYFLVSLSIADLQILIIGLPIALMEFYCKDRWYLGDFMCRATPFLENTSHHCSVLTLLAIGFERYYAICHPLRETVGSRFTAPHILIPVVWITSCVVSLPFAIISEAREETFYDNTVADKCFTDMNSLPARVYILTIFTIFLVLPLLLLTLMYSAIILTLASTTVSGGARKGSAGSSNNGSLSSLNHPGRNIYRMDSEHFNNPRAVASRRQVVRMMLAVMALYFICLVPLRSFQIWVIFSPPEQLMSLGFEGYLNLVYGLRLLMYVNSAGNPIIYGLLSTNFRSAFRKSISCYTNRLDGYRYNTTYYNSQHHRSFGAGGSQMENTPIRNTRFTCAQHRMDSQENLTSIMSTEQMLPLTESGVDTTDMRAARPGSGQDTDFYTPEEVVVNPNYQSLKTEVCMKQFKQNGNVYV